MKRKEYGEPMTVSPSKIAPIFNRVETNEIGGDEQTSSGDGLLSSALAQGSWKIIPDELFVFTARDICHSERIAGFDLDETLISTKSGKVFPKDPDDWKIRSNNVIRMVKKVHGEGFKVCIFTNQRGIQIKKVSPLGFKTKIQRICSKLGIPIQVFISVGNLNYRKPYVGMWEQLERAENGDLTIDRAQSFYVGDAAGRVKEDNLRADHSMADRLFAMNLGVKFMTPEEFFLNTTDNRDYKLPTFQPSSVFASEMFEPADVKIPHPNSEKELLIMVGSPASGKSTIADELAKRYDFVVVNQDTLKTWQNCVKQALEQLEAGQRVLIDNTNRDRETRKRYISHAKALNIPCRCLLMKCNSDQALHNNTFRMVVGLADDNHKSVNEMVIRSFFSNYQEPTVDEGFDEVIRVNFVPKFKEESHKHIYCMYLQEK